MLYRKDRVSKDEERFLVRILWQEVGRGRASTGLSARNLGHPANPTPHTPISKLAGPGLFPRPRAPRLAPPCRPARSCVPSSSLAHGRVPARFTWRAIPGAVLAPSFRRGPKRLLPRPRAAARPSRAATAEVSAEGGGAGGAGARDGRG